MRLYKIAFNMALLNELFPNKNGVEATVNKFIPEELSEHYQFIDPTKPWIADHNIRLEDVVPPPRDVTRKKTHDEIPRVPNHKYDQEDIPEEEHNLVRAHVDNAKQEHHAAIKEKKIKHALN